MIHFLGNHSVVTSGVSAAMKLEVLVRPATSARVAAELWITPQFAPQTSTTTDWAAGVIIDGPVQLPLSGAISRVASLILNQPSAGLLERQALLVNGTSSFTANASFSHTDSTGKLAQFTIIGNGAAGYTTLYFNAFYNGAAFVPVNGIGGMAMIEIGGALAGASGYMSLRTGPTGGSMAERLRITTTEVQVTSTATLLASGAATFQGATTFSTSGSVTFNNGASFASATAALTVSGPSTFSNSATFSSGATFSSSTTFNAPVSMTSTSSYTGAATFSGGAVFGSFSPALTLPRLDVNPVGSLYTDFAANAFWNTTISGWAPKANGGSAVMSIGMDSGTNHGFWSVWTGPSTNLNPAVTTTAQRLRVDHTAATFAVPISGTSLTLSSTSTFTGTATFNGAIAATSTSTFTGAATFNGGVRFASGSDTINYAGTSSYTDTLTCFATSCTASSSFTITLIRIGRSVTMWVGGIQGNSRVTTSSTPDWLKLSTAIPADFRPTLGSSFLIGVQNGAGNFVTARFIVSTDGTTLITVGAGSDYFATSAAVGIIDSYTLHWIV
jgi:hypothetical protein